MLSAFAVSAQGARITWKKKIKEPIEVNELLTLDVGDKIRVLEGVNQDGGFRFVQLLNNFNEPIELANSRVAYMSDKIKFFKEDNGIYYAFTKYFCINLVPALNNQEIEILSK